MFKKLVVGVGLFLLGMTVYPSISSAESTRSRPDIVRFGAESGRVGVPTRSVTIDYYGNILPGRNNSDNVGSSTEAFKTGYFGELFASSGIVNVHELFLDLPASDSDSYKANGAIITTTTLIGGGTTFRLVDLTQSDACMNAVFWGFFYCWRKHKYAFCRSNCLRNQLRRKCNRGINSIRDIDIIWSRDRSMGSNFQCLNYI